jgi:hypothetical protein
MNKILLLLTLQLLSVTSSVVKCQINSTQTNAPNNPYWSVGLFYDQDHTLELLGFDKLNDDRNYTLGFGLLFQSSEIKNFFAFAPNKWLNQIFNHRNKFEWGQSITQKPSYSLMLAGSGFTPDSLPTSSVITNDRPYASIILLQTSINNRGFQRCRNNRSTFTKRCRNNRSTFPERCRNYRSTFTIGFLGASLPGNIQTAIHKAMNDNDTKPPRTPKGWNNQVSNGGELTFAYSYTKEILLTERHINNEAPTRSKGIEFKHGYKYSLGYHTYMGYNLSFRLGWFDANNWVYDTSPLSSANKKNMTEVYKKPFEFYLVGSIRPTFIMYNAMLNGQFKNSIHTVNFNDTRHLIFEFDGGVGLSFGMGSSNGIDIKIKGSGRSPEFKLPGRDARFHYWAGIDLIYSHF